jgi:Transcriptional regulator, AbiEi antitoxin
MNHVDQRIAALSASQRQVFSRAQALAAGLSRSGLSRRVRGGLYVPIGPQTYHLAGAEPPWRGLLLAGVLDLGAGAVVTGRSAAALHGLDGYAEGPVELLVPRGLRKRHAVGSVTSTSSLDQIDRSLVDGLPVTSATRTIIELAGVVSPRELGNAIDSAQRLGLTEPAFLRRRLDDLGRPGRPGAGAVESALGMAGVQSWLERAFLRVIDGVGLPRPKVQRIYRADGVHVGRVDFDFEPLPVIVEVGGRRGYMSASERQRQERRRNQLQLLGKVVYFFCTEDVIRSPGYVVSTLRAALAEAA